jgi:AcrR family transcriptional regulator
MTSIQKVEDVSAPQLSQAPARRAGRPRRLTLDQILDAGLAIGLDNNLTMAAVAERLGVSATVLYGYVGGREELIRFASARAAQDHDFPNDEGQYWAVYAAQHARALFDLMIGPGGLLNQYLSGNMSPEGDLDRTETWLAAMAQRGFKAEEGMALLDDVGIIVLGGATVRLNASALKANGGGYDQIACRALGARGKEEYPLLRSQIEAFIKRDGVWRTTLMKYLECMARDRGEAFPKADVTAILES